MSREGQGIIHLQVHAREQDPHEANAGWLKLIRRAKESAEEAGAKVSRIVVDVTGANDYSSIQCEALRRVVAEQLAREYPEVAAEVVA